MNDKKKSKRFNKKLVRILLIVVVVCTICLNFLGMYVYKSAEKDQDDVNFVSSSSEENIAGLQCETITYTVKDKDGNKVRRTRKSCTRSCGGEWSKDNKYCEAPKPKPTQPSGGKNNSGSEQNSNLTVKLDGTYSEGIESVDSRVLGDPLLQKETYEVDIYGNDNNKGNKTMSDKLALKRTTCKNNCYVELTANVKDPNDKGKVRWIKNGELTDEKGSTLKVQQNKKGNDVWTCCIEGETCPEKKKPTPSNPAKKNNGSKKNEYPNKVNKEVWATDGEYSGDTIKCGDKLYITACNNDTDPICKVSKINGKSVKKTTLIKKSHYVENEADTGCYQNATRYVQKDSYYYTDSDLSKGKKNFPCGDQVTLKKTIEVACNDKSCEVEYNGKIIYLPKDALITYKPTCSSDPAGTCNSSEKQTNVVGNVTIKICNKEDNIENRDKFVTCATDYKKYYKLVNDQCGENPNDSCYREYEFTCTFGKAPGISASAGILDADGFGTINITGYDYGNVGLKGYFISPGYTPTESYKWEPFDSNNKATTKQPAGTYFVWAMNNKNVMSNSVLVKVYDADLSTTMKSFTAIDDHTGDILQLKQMDNKVANADQIVDAKYALLSNKLLADADGTGFDKLTTSYEITTTSNKIALYATLTSEDAGYIEGFEPRTVYLDYGENTVLISIVNNEGRERTYSFIVNRVDDRDNDSTLKSVKLSKGKIDFDPYVTNYDVEIGKNTKKVSINAELNSEYAYFVEGYEPRTIDITEDKQSALIKVMSETESIRTYVFTFTKKGYVEEPTDSAYLSSLTVPGTQFAFDRETYEYTITVPFGTDRIPIYAFAESENATVEISDSNDLDVGNNQVEITVTNGKNSKIYNLNIIRKQEGLDVSNSTKLGMLSIKGYNINFDPNVLDYTVKIKREKTLMIAATPESNRADIYMYGNNDLTGFSTVRVKVIAENGATEIYSIDIKKDAYNKKLEIIVASLGCLVIIISGIIIISKRKKNNKKEYMEG